MEKVEVACGKCEGQGWYSGSEAGHDCGGTEESCQRNCPIEVQIQVQCEECQGTGKYETVKM